MQKNEQMIADESALGKKSDYISTYDPSLLYGISRAEKRKEIGIDPTHLPFMGFDQWNHYEVSWLNEKGKPLVALAEISYDCQSPNLVESKSLKLYFNSFNNTKIKTINELEARIKVDLQNCVGASVQVHIRALDERPTLNIIPSFTGESLDGLDVACSLYQVEPALLETELAMVEETLHSNLLKSNCLVTHQPDWGSLQIAYTGRKINRESLLKYIVSFRNHNEFHEQCIERIFMDLMTRCRPEKLTVYGRYTRRGGLDINPFRTTEKERLIINNQRLIRQ